MQQITITGYLSRDAESSETQRGDKVTRWSVPVKQKDESTVWYRVSIWGKRAEYAGRCRKGEFVTVTGSLDVGEYQGKPQFELNAADFHSVRTAPRDSDSPAPARAAEPAADDWDSSVPF